MVTLRAGEADRVVAGHPWIYAGSVARVSGPVTDGAVVQVKDARERSLGIGFYNGRSKIHVRMLARERVGVDQAFFEQRIRGALALRQRHLPGATSFRVINAEGDFLSGLIVDKYEDVLVLQTSSLGMDQRKGEIVAALCAVLAPRAILERNEIATRKFEGLPATSGVLFGEAGGRQEVILNGLRFTVDLATGHKTGLYLDQQTNHQRVADLVARYPNARVADAFTFLGGFALHAARAGAASVVGVDQSEEAVEAARRNAASNGLTDRCTFEAANVFDWLKTRTAPTEGLRPGPQFDVVVLDPPSFTRNRAAIHDALRGYKEIHLRALKLLRPGGTLATFCCSHHIDPRTFQDVILAAAFDARRVLRRVAAFSQSLDHPVIPSIPETEYLKGYAFELAD